MDTGIDRPPASSLWRNRSFGIFWGAQTMSVAGDAFAAVAVPLLVLQLTGSVARMGLLTAVAGAASVGTAVFAGTVVDRVDRRTLLIWCDVFRAVLYGLVPVVWLLAPSIWLLYLVLPLGAAVGMLFQVGYVTAVPNLVDAGRITEANGRLSASFATAGIGGPLLAGVVCARFGPPVAIAVDAASFAVSALCLTLVRLRRSPPSDRGDGSVRAVRDEFLAGARFLLAHPVLRAMTVLLSVFVFLTYGLNDVLIFHVKHDLGGSDAQVGVVLGTGALGTVLGALVVAPLRRRVGFGACWIGSTTVAGLAAAAVGRTTGVPVLAAVLAAYLCCLTVGGICSMSLRQEVTPDHLLGRVTSAFWAIHFSLGPAGAVATTWGAERFGVGWICGIVGGGCLLVALAALPTPVRG